VITSVKGNGTDVRCKPPSASGFGRNKHYDATPVRISHMCYMLRKSQMLQVFGCVAIPLKIVMHEGATPVLHYNVCTWTPH
jgi:hypothetical protein